MNPEDYGISKRSFIDSKIGMWRDSIASYLVQIEDLEEKIEGAVENIVDLEQELYELNNEKKS